MVSARPSTSATWHVKNTTGHAGCPGSRFHDRATKVLSFAVRSIEGSFRVVRELQAPGLLYMEETLRLDAGDPVIRLRAEIELLPDPPAKRHYGFGRAQCGVESRLRFCGIANKAG